MATADWLLFALIDSFLCSGYTTARLHASAAGSSGTSGRQRGRLLRRIGDHLRHASRLAGSGPATQDHRLLDADARLQRGHADAGV